MPSTTSGHKSYVSMEQHVCPVCGESFDTGVILMDRRLRDSMERHTATGFELCDACKKLKEQGYVALVESDPEKSNVYYENDQPHTKPQDAYRTGRVMHMRRQAFDRIFNIPVPEKMVCFIEPEVFEKIKAIVPEDQDADQESP